MRKPYVKSRKAAIKIQAVIKSLAPRLFLLKYRRIVVRIQSIFRMRK